MGYTGSPACSSWAFSWGLAGFTAMPRWVTSTSTVSPGVDTGQYLVHHDGQPGPEQGRHDHGELGPGGGIAVSARAALIWPLESVCTLTLK